MVIRPAEPERDYPAIAALHTAYNYDFRHAPLTVADLHEYAQRPGRIRHQFVAVDGDTLLGNALVLHGPWLPAGTFSVTILVDPAVRGRGVGTGLLDAAVADARSQGGILVETEVADDDPASLAFAERRGFTTGYHRFKSTLTVADFDPSPYAGLLAAVDDLGVRIQLYADRPDHRRKLYELHCRGDRDEPSSTGDSPPFDEYIRLTFDRPDVAVFVATAGPDWIGLAQLTIGPSRAHHELTCVDRPWRERGIAQALKVRAVAYAQQLGIAVLTTSNDSRNAPMLAINRKFGYRPELGVHQLVAPVQQDGAVALLDQWTR